MQITPNLLESNLNPHKLEMIKEDGRWNKLVGRKIEGKDVKHEINLELNEVKIRFKGDER